MLRDVEFDYRRKYGCRAIKNLAEILFSAVTKTDERFKVFDKYEEISIVCDNESIFSYLGFIALGAHIEFGPNGVREFDPTHPKELERYKRQLDEDELLNLSPEELCKDRVSEEYFRLTTEGDCRDVVRYRNCNTYPYFR